MRLILLIFTLALGVAGTSRAASPTEVPTDAETPSPAPTAIVTVPPTATAAVPTPTRAATPIPTATASPVPATPTPKKSPSLIPTVAPTLAPTLPPTSGPTAVASKAPTATRTPLPTSTRIATPLPTRVPTLASLPTPRPAGTPGVEARVLVYPHPLTAAGGNASYPMENAGQAHLWILTLRGQVLREFRESKAASAKAVTRLDLNGLDQGLYFLKIVLLYDRGGGKTFDPVPIVLLR